MTTGRTDAGQSGIQTGTRTRASSTPGRQTGPDGTGTGRAGQSTPDRYATASLGLVACGAVRGLRIHAPIRLWVLSFETESLTGKAGYRTRPATRTMGSGRTGGRAGTAASTGAVGTSTAGPGETITLMARGCSRTRPGLPIGAASNEGSATEKACTSPVPAPYTRDSGLRGRCMALVSPAPRMVTSL